MNPTSIKNMIRNLVFWGIVLAATVSLLLSLLVFLSPERTEAVFQHLSIEEGYAYGQWGTMIVSILIFSYFVLLFAQPMKKVEWRSLGVYEAFLVALFTEMYGFPLTIYILTTVFGVSLSFGHREGHLLAAILSRTGVMGLNRSWAFVMWLSSLLLLFGFFLVREGWRKVYHSKGELVTDGIYARIRHPQYLGIIIITVAFLIQWPTILTLLMWPILVTMYSRLAKREEKGLQEKFGEVYLEYQNRVPMFMPFHYKNKQVRER
jgi:protein-S-isoprenylcysteine O-methyltransferase Ste14